MRLLLFLCLVLANCAGSDKVLRAAQDDNRQMSTKTPGIRGNYVALPDSLPKRRLFGLLPAKKPAAAVPGYTFGKKSTVIIQTGTGNTAATATKPGTMATGTEATAVDAGKARAPVQTGTANQATDNTKAGQRGGAAATAPGASAEATNKGGGTPWWVYAVCIGAGGVGGWMLRGKASVWSWWPAWARPG
ncbi:hypothetical protein HER32_12040 [Hymenobacter sp. BT18]|uniref:hypothetical protein n=1 Tax=Hymenobacter sp. BT18 TaxID=2835648 RepID=UPI00143E4F57|nr:hypothetical protein [Hymenobacter sp. BT18]QIX61873.1 hypothetical protein HER32_12040 [Hymenobacter sp. BT18]